MRIVDAAAIDRVLDRNGLVEALRAAFRDEVTVPVRHHHAIPRPDADAAMLLLMPAWQSRAGEGGFGHLGVKLVSVFPGNAGKGVATVQGSYLRMSGETGAPVALLDGPRLTLWRTAAASALAADHLARPDARRLLMIGAGALAAHLIAAHAAIRPIEEVAVWNRTPERAAELAARLDRPGLSVRAVDDLAAALGAADIVSSATLSAVPLVAGAHLPPGVHVDLVGGFTPAMREADDAAVRRARVYVDTRAGAAAEAGDIVQPLASGALAAIEGDLFELCRGTAKGRTSAEEITLFKSVGTAIEDLAAAVHVIGRLDAL